MEDMIDSLNKNPHEQFIQWREKAQKMGLSEIDVVTVATVCKENKPHARVMLYKGLIEEKFSLYTNYDSNKAIQMAANPHVALSFYWYLPLGYQVRVGGRVEKMSREQSEAYFMSRPRGSRLSAWASEQSSPLVSREELEAKISEVAERFEGKDVPCPENWGGYLLTANYFEFMVLDMKRAHDRFSYTKDSGGWKIQRLAP